MPISDALPAIPPCAKLKLDGDALVANWKTLNDLSGKAQAGAAVKADGYGLGAVEVTRRLLEAGCRDFFVATWKEARQIASLTNGNAAVSVLNGIRNEDMAFAMQSDAKPVLNSLEQVVRWSSSGRPCDLMINSGMNRLGINVDDLPAINAAPLIIDLVMSHLASADEDVPQNTDQLEDYKAGLEIVSGKRTSLANSAGIALGADYHFDCTRPGLSLYGGVQRAELAGHIKQVATPQAQILQTRRLHSGDQLGYNAGYTAKRSHDIAIIAMGYADGYLRGFSNTGRFFADNVALPVLGRVSMDLVAIDISAAPQLGEGHWVNCDYNLPNASAMSGLSQYELITGLGQRFSHEWG